MSTPIITIEDGTLTITNIQMTDDVTVAYVGQFEQDRRVAAVVNCLQLGARALTFAGEDNGAALLAETFKKESLTTQSLLTNVSTTAQRAVEKSTETLEKTVADLLESLAKDLNRTLDPANTESIIGKLRNALVNDYRNVTEKVRQDLDLANPQSPLSALRAEMEKGDERRFAALNNQVAELVKGLAAKAAAREQRDKSTRKGSDFETVTLDYLTEEARPRKDAVSFTGKELGLDQNLIGDFVVEVNPAEALNLRIVIETKNGQEKSAQKHFRELDRAISNRAATFGISLLAGSEDNTQSIQPFGDDKLIVRVPVLPDGDGWDFTLLGMALECARYKALISRKAAGSLDINRLNADIEQAIAVTNSFAEVKKKITSGKTVLDGIADYLDDLKRQIVAALTRIRRTIAEADSCEAEAA